MHNQKINKLKVENLTFDIKYSRKIGINIIGTFRSAEDQKMCGEVWKVKGAYA